MPTSALRLEVAEFTNADRWRWVLKEHNGAYLADHTVTLDRSNPSYMGLVDLPGYLRRYAAPDTRDVDERRLIREVGAWVGEYVLGRDIGEKLRARTRPTVVVRVLVPPQAERLLTLPLEIARLDNGEPLSATGVSFVYETAGTEPPHAEPVGECLRILALFSLPPVGSPLNLRRERQMLRDLIRQLAGANGLGVELRVLQYGVTRDSLEDLLGQAEGWDVIHFSGHGQPGSLLLEHPDGRPDEVSSTELAGLLRQAGGRVKLVTLSACLSAAASVDQTLSWLGLPPEVAPRRDVMLDPAAAEQAMKAAPSVSRALTEALNCAVLAMRYAVEDEFAAAMGRELYDQLFRQGQALPLATQRALARVAGSRAGTPGCSALSAAAPALFGSRATDLTLVPPRRSGIRTDVSLAYVPHLPAHFVGRVGAMTRASAALAAESKRSGVLFHGMAGAGKSSCAVELVYHHAAVGRFQAFVWYSAPEQGKDIALALRDFALAVERHLGLEMLHLIDRVEALRKWLPTLVEVMENNAVLLVLDNLESLLTEAGQWRDERWGLVVEALLTPGGLSRTLLTSRTRPAKLPGSAEIIAVHALPRDEAILLVRELPNLRRLLNGKASGVGEAEGRQLVYRALHLVQGHPKLIELAEGLAADPAQLAGRLDQVDAAQDASASELDAFFTEGQTRLDAATFTVSLRGWTRGVAGALVEAARVFFHFLCVLEESDRLGWVIEANWSKVWQRLGRAEPAPEVATVLGLLVESGLMDRQASGTGEVDYTALIHAGVAEAGRTEARAALQAVVDYELTYTWWTVWQQAWDAHDREPWAGAVLVRAGLAAFPYLARLNKWETAAAMLERVVLLDRSPGTLASVLPLAQRLVAATTGTGDETHSRILLAKVLQATGRSDETETLLREVITQAAARSDFASAAAASGDLANLLRNTGRYQPALRVVVQMAKYTIRAGSGPWAQIADIVRSLQILNDLGEWNDVLNKVAEILVQMQDLPDPPGADDQTINVSNVRETALDTGRQAAVELGKWQQALDLNARHLQSKADRGATAFDQAQGQVSDYFPLLNLKRYDEADKLLHHCRLVFEQSNAVSELGLVFGALADLEGRRGHFDIAKRLEETALRYKYASGMPDDAANSHFNLANHLIGNGDEWHDVLGHRLAAALIRVATLSGRLADAISFLANDLSHAGKQAVAALPADFAGVCAVVQRVPGVRFQEWMARLLPDEDPPDRTLQAIVVNAKKLTDASDRGRSEEEQG